MTHEVEHLSNTLMWTVGMITRAGPDDLERMAKAYREAQDLVSQILKTEEGARPRIATCYHRSDEYRAADDVACVGWVLTAIQERVNEGDLRDWRKLRTVVRQMVELLQAPAPSLH